MVSSMILVFGFLLVVTSFQKIDSNSSTVEEAPSDGKSESLPLLANTSEEDLWDTKLNDAIYQANRATEFTLPELKARVNNIDAILAKIETQYEQNLGESKALFELVAAPIRTAIEIAWLLQKVPIENATYDKVKELVHGGLAAVTEVKTDLTVNNSRIIYDVKETLSRTITAKELFTPPDLSRLCYPDGSCVEARLQDLISSIQNTKAVIAVGANEIYKTFTRINQITGVKAYEEANKISTLAREWAETFLKSQNVTKDTIRQHYRLAIKKYNPTFQEVKTMINKGLQGYIDANFYIEYYSNLSRNWVFGSGYPVVDAFNIVKYLNRNYGGTVLGNQIQELNVQLANAYSQTVRFQPDVSAQMNTLYQDFKVFNNTASLSVIQFLEKDINETSITELIEYHALYSGLVNKYVTQPIDEVMILLTQLMLTGSILVKEVEEGYGLAYGGTPGTIPYRFLDETANALYSGGNITHKDIHFYGTNNLNNSINYWYQLINKENFLAEEAYRAVAQKNYSALSIYNDIVDIAQRVLNVLMSHESDFGAALVAKRSAEVYLRLVTVTNDEFTKIVNANLVNITQLYNLKSVYLQHLALTDISSQNMIKTPVQTYVGLIDYSQFYNVYIYQNKLKLDKILKNIRNVKEGILASEAKIIAVASSLVGRTKRIADEYTAVLLKYAALKEEGKPFVADIPSIKITALRIMRDEYGLKVYNLTGLSED